MNDCGQATKEPPSVPPSALDVAANKAIGGAQGLRDMVLELRERLRPVMRDEDTVKPPAEDSPQDSPNECEMARRMRAISEVQEEACSVVQDMFRLLEV